MQYIIGLDLGITSIGWAIYNHTDNKIVKCGVRLFEVAENPKTKESLASPRREARGQRRRIRRRAYRMRAIRQYMITSNLLSEYELNNLFQKNKKTTPKKSHYDIYELRNNALIQALSNQQLAQILIHLCKHRGFKSNRKKDKTIDGKVNNSLKENTALMQKNNYRTIGEMLYKDEKFATNKRNRFGEYRVMLQRVDIANEAEEILKTQKAFGNNLITDDFIKKYLEIFSWQKSFDWKGNIIEMVGNCQFEQDEKRAPKACFSSETFIALSKLNNIKYVRNTQEHSLDKEQIQKIMSLALMRKTKTFNITFATLRKELSLGDDIRFNFVKYKSIDDYQEIEKTEKIKELEFRAYHELKSIICESVGEITWNNLVTNIQLLDEIAIVLTYNKTDDTIKEALHKCFKSCSHNFLHSEVIQIISALIENGVSFEKNINLSLKALYKIIPHLKSALQYDKACSVAGYNHSAKITQRSLKLKTIQEIGLDNELTNPVVIRAISQVRKVINAIIHIYGAPYQINIELARDLGKTAQQRNEITKFQKENQANNDKYYKLFIEYFNRAPAKDELLKYKLYKQQDCRCAYSGIYINLDDIRAGTNATQIDHIIPHSRSFDDSMNNKVLCLTVENQHKGNQIPFEYIAKQNSNSEEWLKFQERCNNMLKHGKQYGFNYKKHQLLLTKSFNQEGFIERNLNDTRYISRFCVNYLKNYLQFSDPTNKVPVRVLNGQATAFIRRHWGLNKSRDENDLHHAQDACVIAAISGGIVQKITSYMQAKSYGSNQDLSYTDHETGEIFNRFPEPYLNFRDEVQAKVREVFVSRMPKRKISGKVHDDTIRSRKYVDNPIAEYNKGNPFSTINKRLSESNITLNKDGEIDKLCPTYKHHNLNIYNLLVDRLSKYGNDCKKAFVEPLFAPRKDGTPSDTQIKTVKIIQAQNTGVAVNKGIADNGGMVRIDIFTKNSKNYIVPIYLSDVIKDELPKETSNGITIDESYMFRFSLFSKDLICITKDGITQLVYYVNYDRASPSNIVFMLPDGRGYNPWTTKSDCRLSIQKLDITKYQVDVLGNYIKVAQEKRLNFNFK